eukprot:16385641-Heterocapsa_arctica.AAC.1
MLPHSWGHEDLLCTFAFVDEPPLVWHYWYCNPVGMRTVGIHLRDQWAIFDAVTPSTQSTCSAALSLRPFTLFMHLILHIVNATMCSIDDRP